MAKKAKAKKTSKAKKAKTSSTTKKAKAKKASGAKKAKTKKAAPKAMLGAGPPPYKCDTTGEPGTCLRFNRNPKTGQYNLPPEGIRVNCTECEYFFD
jgi:hypothetical protein